MSDRKIEHGIIGEALIALQHEELKEMGIASAGHRLKILKEVYEVKITQDVPIEDDDYLPPCMYPEDLALIFSNSCTAVAALSEYEKATKDDILKLTNAILKLRDDRIYQLETQLTKMADDSRKLRTELWPLFKMVKEREPLPYRPNENSAGSPEYTQETLISPPLLSADTEKQKSSLTRTFSKKLGLSSGTPKNNSPTHFPSTIPEGKATHDSDRIAGLQPSAAASAASNSLTAGMSGGTTLQHHNYSPNPNSPTSPLPMMQHQPLISRSFQREPSSGYPRYDGPDDSLNYGRSAIPTPPLTGIAHDPISNRSATTLGIKSSASNMSNASTLLAHREAPGSANPLTVNREMSASVPPGGLSRPSKDSKDGSGNKDSGGGSAGGDSEDPSVQIFKSFRVALDDPCWKVLPAALRKYNIQADWRQYALYIVYGDQERCVGLEEKPLALFKDLDREGKKPMFMLRKLANGIVGDVPNSGGAPLTALGGIRPGTAGAGVQSSAASVRTMGMGGEARNLPGGII